MDRNTCGFVGPASIEQERNQILYAGSAQTHCLHSSIVSAVPLVLFQADHILDCRDCPQVPESPAPAALDSLAACWGAR